MNKHNTIHIFFVKISPRRLIENAIIQTPSPFFACSKMATYHVMYRVFLVRSIIFVLFMLDRRIKPMRIFLITLSYIPLN